MAQSRVPTSEQGVTASGTETIADGGFNQHDAGVTQAELGEDTLLPAVTPVENVGGSSTIQIGYQTEAGGTGDLSFRFEYSPFGDEFRVEVYNDSGDRVTYNWSITRHRT
jgi:hypothetical protein